MTVSQSVACQRLSALGIPKALKLDILDTVAKWQQSSGTEWTVERLKQLKLLYIKRAAGEEYHPSWVALDSKGLPKGPLKPLFRVDKRDHKEFFRNLSALMVYSVEFSPTVTPKQWEKFRSSCEDGTAPDIGPVALDPYFRIGNTLNEDAEKLLKRKWRKSDYSAQVFYTGPLSDERRAPYWCPTSGRTRTAPETEPEKWFMSQALNQVNLEDGILWDTFDEGLLDYVITIPKVQSNAALSQKLKEVDPGPPSYGRVSFIQEPGYKLRTVANPNRIIQWRLNPLKVHLKECLKTLYPRHDFTHDQDAGIAKIQSWLSNNIFREKIHCVDLADATNHFPLDLQLYHMKTVCPTWMHADIRLFAKAARGPWRVYDPIGKHEREIRWSKGQPLGLGPSFFAFAFTHCCLLDSLMRKCDDNHCDYAVIGDDVAILGDDLHKRYTEALHLLGVPVSGPKCLSSPDVAEFAGKIITETKVFPQLKFRQISDRNFLDIARLLGPRSLGIFPPRQRRILRLVAEGPVEEGGLGWNPKGRSYSERLSSFMKVSRRLTRESEMTTDLSSYERQKREFDFMLRTGFSAQVQNTEPLVRPEPKSTEALPFMRNRKGDVSSIGGDPRGPTTLEILERKLKGLDPWDDGLQDLVSPGTEELLSNSKVAEESTENGFSDLPTEDETPEHRSGIGFGR